MGGEGGGGGEQCQCGRWGVSSATVAYGGGGGG